MVDLFMQVSLRFVIKKKIYDMIFMNMLENSFSSNLDLVSNCHIKKRCIHYSYLKEAGNVLSDLMMQQRNNANIHLKRIT